MANQHKLSGSELIVKKFGGTSVGSIERIEAVAEQIAQAFYQGEQQLIVLSAMAGETNRLLSLGAAIDSHASSRELDMLVATGEQVSIALMAMALHKRGIAAKSLIAGQISIMTDANHGRAKIERIDTSTLTALLADNVIPIVAGFQGCHQGNITTLGRGGSDTTAVALAAALSAKECQIYTDVAGVFTTDPNLETNAVKLSQINVDTMFEMARLGAKVLHPDSVDYARRFQVPLRVLSSFEPGCGTLITPQEEPLTQGRIVGMAVSHSQAIIHLQRSPQHPIVWDSLADQLAAIGIETNLLSKDESSHLGLSFTVDKLWLPKVLTMLDLMASEQVIESVQYVDNQVRLSLIGNGLLDHVDVMNKARSELSEIDVDVNLMSATAAKVAMVFCESKLNVAIRALHYAFQLNDQ
ncbi:aspartate kinase [Shewanella sp. NIFS-20-20]|uniref:aspartate kinase n=1 Tax=Shewanella sp. NIFS-20-20 TaxID=2853806 RepID=UPI001C43A996|nr:aspartate kinase [Shewanella sp. NIFS-20-20]